MPAITDDDLPRIRWRGHRIDAANRKSNRGEIAPYPRAVTGKRGIAIGRESITRRGVLGLTVLGIAGPLSACGGGFEFQVGRGASER